MDTVGIQFYKNEGEKDMNIITASTALVPGAASNSTTVTMERAADVISSAEGTIKDTCRKIAKGDRELAHLEKEEQECARSKEILDSFLAQTPEERGISIKTHLGTPLSREIDETVSAKLQSNSFRIWAGFCISGSIATIGILAAAVAGAAVSTSAAMIFPGALVAGVAVSRIYRRVAEKWSAPGMRDKVGKNYIVEIQDKLDKRIETIKTDAGRIHKDQEALRQSIAPENWQNLPDMAPGNEAAGGSVEEGEDFISIDDVKIKINKSLGYISMFRGGR
jgi:hypothetical protein